MRQVRLIVLMVMVCLLSSAVQAGTIQRKTVDEAKEFLLTSPNPVALLDVRSAKEYSTGHIRGALLFNYHGDDFERKLSLLPRHFTYVVYSEKNNRSSRTAQKLKGMNFNVIHMDGGLQEWKRKGYPLVK